MVALTVARTDEMSQHPGRDPLPRSCSAFLSLHALAILAVEKWWRAPPGVHIFLPASHPPQSPPLAIRCSDSGDFSKNHLGSCADRMGAREDSIWKPHYQRFVESMPSIELLIPAAFLLMSSHYTELLRTSFATSAITIKPRAVFHSVCSH